MTEVDNCKAEMTHEEARKRILNGLSVWFCIYEYSFIDGIGAAKRNVKPTRLGKIEGKGRKARLHLTGRKGQAISKSYLAVSDCYRRIDVPLYTNEASCIEAYKARVNEHRRKLAYELDESHKRRVREISIVDSALKEANSL